MFSTVEKRYTAGQIGIPGQGPFMTVVLTLEGDVINQAQFQTYPCPAANACGNFVTGWAEGKRLSDISSLTDTDIIEGIGAMPLGREHCPKLAVDALKDALVRLQKLEEPNAEVTH